MAESQPAAPRDIDQKASRLVNTTHCTALVRTIILRFAPQGRAQISQEWLQMHFRGNAAFSWPIFNLIEPFSSLSRIKPVPPAGDARRRLRRGGADSKAKKYAMTPPHMYPGKHAAPRTRLSQHQQY